MAENPDPAGARDRAGTEPAEGAEHDALDVAEWVSELRRLYVEPTTRAGVQQEGGKALLRRKFHIGGPKRASPPVESDVPEQQLSPMKLSPAFVPGSPHHPSPGPVPPAPDTDVVPPVGDRTAILPAAPVPEGESERERDRANASTSAASEDAEGTGGTEGPSSAAWLLSYLEATGSTTTAGHPEAADDVDQTSASAPDHGGEVEPQRAPHVEVEPGPVPLGEVEAEPDLGAGSEPTPGRAALTREPELGTEVSGESEPEAEPEPVAEPRSELLVTMGDELEPVAERDRALMDVGGLSLTSDAEPEPDLQPQREAEAEAAPEPLPEAESGPEPEPAPEPEQAPLRWVRPPSEPPRDPRSGDLVAEPADEGSADHAATAQSPGHEEGSVAPVDETAGAGVPAATSHQVTVAWRGEDAMGYLELDGPSGADPEDLIIVEPPSQLFASGRRRRPEHPPEPDTPVDVTPDEPDEVPVHELPSVRAPSEPPPAARPTSGSGKSGLGRGVLLLVALLVILAALVWFFLLRGSDPASVGSSARDGMATVAAALDTAKDPGDLTI